MFASQRVGFGTDLHRLVPGDGFYLGGVFIPCRHTCVARSDGDVLLHALVDALLGALGMGDIGERYPEHSVEKGQASSRFVSETVRLLAPAGAQVVNVDCVVNLECVRLSPYKAAIAASLAALLAIPSGRVNIKAKSAEGLGPIGLSQAVSAEVVVLLGIAKEEGETVHGQASHPG